MKLSTFSHVYWPFWVFSFICKSFAHFSIGVSAFFMLIYSSLYIPSSFLRICCRYPLPLCGLSLNFSKCTFLLLLNIVLNFNIVQCIFFI